MKHYVGIQKCNGRYVSFTSAEAPTFERFGSRFNAVIGPFKTMRGAKWAERHGRNNPHFQTVADAERLSR